MTRAQDAHEAAAPTMTLMLGDAADSLLQHITASAALAAARFSLADAQRVQSGPTPAPAPRAGEMAMLAPCAE